MASKLKFEAETQEILNLVTHSIYSDKNIFLRELISNSSDALEKLKFESLKNTEIMDKNEELRIDIQLDKQNGTITVEDNGIGMSKEEVVSNIGTIAKSGSKEFASKLLEAKDKNDRERLIGQFGVGFYSSFMVAKEVHLSSKEYSSKGVIWKSTGNDSYEINDDERDKRGTKITLFLNDQSKDLLDRNKLISLISEHSNYIQFPIRVSEKGEEDKKEEQNKVVNSLQPIWSKNKGEVEDKEYANFYISEFHEWEDPFDKIHIKVEGNIEYSSIIFIPNRLAEEFFSPGFSRGVKLYSKNILIMDSCTSLLPRHLQFLHGVVNSPDISLNISREMLQKDNKVSTISKHLEKKIIEFLKEMMKNDEEKYSKFWTIFGKAIKMGVYSDFDAREKLKDLIMFETAKSEKPISLKEYVEKSGENEILYAAGDSRESIENLPQMEKIVSSDNDVLYFTDPIDELVISSLGDFEGKKFKSIASEEKEDLKLSKEEEEIISKMGEELKDRVSSVKISNKLSKSPSCISNSEGISLNMERVFGKGMAGLKAKKVLEINREHPIFDLLRSSYQKDEKSFKEYSSLLYSMATILEGLKIENPGELIEKISTMMLKSSGAVN